MHTQLLLSDPALRRVMAKQSGLMYRSYGTLGYARASNMHFFGRILNY